MRRFIKWHAAHEGENFPARRRGIVESKQPPWPTLFLPAHSFPCFRRGYRPWSQGFCEGDITFNPTYKYHKVCTCLYVFFCSKSPPPSFEICLWGGGLRTHWITIYLLIQANFHRPASHPFVFILNTYFPTWDKFPRARTDWSTKLEVPVSAFFPPPNSAIRIHRLPPELKLELAAAPSNWN